MSEEKKLEIKEKELTLEGNKINTTRYITFFPSTLKMLHFTSYALATEFFYNLFSCKVCKLTKYFQKDLLYDFMQPSFQLLQERSD